MQFMRIIAKDKQKTTERIKDKEGEKTSYNCMHRKKEDEAHIIHVENHH